MALRGGAAPIPSSWGAVALLASILVPAPIFCQWFDSAPVHVLHAQDKHAAPSPSKSVPMGIKWTTIFRRQSAQNEMTTAPLDDPCCHVHPPMPHQPHHAGKNPQPWLEQPQHRLALVPTKPVCPNRSARTAARRLSRCRFEKANHMIFGHGWRTVFHCPSGGISTSNSSGVIEDKPVLIK